jgi:polar amino acid transport system substrate-binding protein
MAGGQVLPPQAIRSGAKGSTVAVLVIVFLVVGFVAGGYIGAPLFGWKKPETTAEKTTIVVGTNTPFPPMEFRDPTSGALEGLDIDLMNEIGARNNWTIVWRDFQDWDALLAAIKFQGVDIGASSITMSGTVGADRNSSFDFSNPYYESDQAILVKVGSTAVNCAAAQCTADELANHTVAVQTLTTSYWWIMGNLVDTAKTPASMVSDFGDLNSVIQELVNGNVDWVLVDKPIAENLVAGNAQLRIEGTIETNELYGFATADGDPNHLIPKINSALAAMKADGKYAEIMHKWLG